MQNLVAEYVLYLQDEQMLLPSTIERYVTVVRHLDGWLAADGRAPRTLLTTVTKEDVINFLRVHPSNIPSRATWNTRLSALRSFYQFLIRQGHVSVNPALLVMRHRTSTTERLPLSFEELVRLVDEVDEGSSALYRSRNVALVQVLIHSALRVNELVSLNLDQADFLNSLFLNVTRKGNKQLLIPFNAVVAEALRSYLAERERLASPGETALFVSDRGRRISVRRVQMLIKDAGARAGISRIVTPHLLRHSATTEYAKLGVPLSVIQGILGHASIKTTERYIHITSRERAHAVALFGTHWQQHHADSCKHS
jgi:integrase/recombinase XerC